MRRFIIPIVYHLVLFGTILLLLLWLDQFILRMQGGPFNALGLIGWMIRFILWTSFVVTLIFSLAYEFPVHRLRTVCAWCFSVLAMLCIGWELKLTPSSGSGSSGTGGGSTITTGYSFPGWQPAGMSTEGWQWFKPNAVNQATSEVDITRKVVTYRIWNDAVWELRLKDGSTMSLFNKADERTKFKAGPEGFSKTPMTDQEFQDLIDRQAVAIKFKPLPGKTLDMKIGVRDTMP